MTRFFILFFILLLSLNLAANNILSGGIYIQNTSSNVSYNLISQSTNFSSKLNLGKTYYVDLDIMEIKTKTNETVNIAFSNGIKIQVSSNSTFSVDSFNQYVSTISSNPVVFVSESSILSLSLLEGESTIIAPKQSDSTQIIVQTPFVNVNVAEGKLLIHSTSKYMILNAIEGSVTVIDSKSKRNVIDKGNLGLIIPYPGKDGEIMVTQKVISPEDFAKYSAILIELEKMEKEVLFIIIDQKILGVGLK